MPIQIQPNEGIVLSGFFDRSAPGFQKEIDEFTQTLTRLQNKLGFSAFIPMIKEEGSKITVHVIPAQETASPQAAPAAQAVQNLGRTLSSMGKDTFTGTGPLKAPENDPLADFKKLL